MVSFGRKIFKFCLKIKTFAQMLESEVFSAKFSTMILNIAKMHKNLVKKSPVSRPVNFENFLERLKNDNCFQHRG